MSKLFYPQTSRYFPFRGTSVLNMSFHYTTMHDRIRAKTLSSHRPSNNSLFRTASSRYGFFAAFLSKSAAHRLRTTIFLESPHGGQQINHTKLKASTAPQPSKPGIRGLETRQALVRQNGRRQTFSVLSTSRIVWRASPASLSRRKNFHAGPPSPRHLSDSEPSE